MSKKRKLCFFRSLNRIFNLRFYILSLGFPQIYLGNRSLNRIFAVRMALTCRIVLVMTLLFVLRLKAQALVTDTMSVTNVTDTLVQDNGSSDEERRKKGMLAWLVNYLRNANKESDKPFDCSIVAGPFYDATSSLSLGGGISALYSWDRDDDLLKKSTLSVMAKLSIKGMVSIDVTGKNYMKHDRQRWNYRLEVIHSPMDFWGIGYENGLNDDNKGRYKQANVRFTPDYLFRLCKNLYLGPMMNLKYTYTYDLSTPSLIEEQHRSITSVGMGAAMSYDSRDVAMNAYRGQYLRIEHLVYPKGMNRHAFSSTDVTFSTYHGLWKNAVLAMEYHSLFNHGNRVPWTMLAQVAEETNRMRGYYEGRYRDRNIIEAQAEIRQRLPKRFGLVAFVGAANVFSDFQDINLHHTLPNYGGGVRWEFKERVNLRLDVGMTKNRPGVVFNINEAF